MRSAFPWLLALAVLAVLATGTYLVVARAVTGDLARTELERALGMALGGEASVKGLYWSGTRFGAAEVVVRGGPSSPIQFLEARGLSSDLDLRALWHKTFQIREIVADDLAVEFKVPLTTATPPPPPPSPAPPAEEATAPDDSSSPKWRTTWNIISVRKLSLSWPMQQGQYGELNNANLTLTPLHKGAKLTVSSGQLRIPNIPPANLKLLHATYLDQYIDLQEAQLEGQNAGRVTLSGGVHLSQSVRYQLRASVEDWPVEELLRDPWDQRIGGRLWAPIVVEGEGGKSDVRSDIQLRQATLNVDAFLGGLASKVGLKEWIKLPLDEASAKLHIQPDRTEISQITLRSAKWIEIQGNCNILGDALQGSFQVTPSEQMLALMPGTRETIFASSDASGRPTATMNLSGTTSSPQNDLTSRVAETVGQRVQETFQNLLQKFF